MFHAVGVVYSSQLIDLRQIFTLLASVLLHPDSFLVLLISAVFALSTFSDANTRSPDGKGCKSPIAPVHPSISDTKKIILG